MPAPARASCRRVSPLDAHNAGVICSSPPSAPRSGQRFSDAGWHGAIRALQLVFAGLAAVLFVLTFTAHNPWLAVATVLLWGAVAFGNVPGLQVYVVQQAERVTPQAVDVASGLNIAAFNLGIAGGAFAGGAIVDHLGLMHTPWIGAIVVLGALGLTSFMGRLYRRRSPRAGTARAAAAATAG